MMGNELKAAVSQSGHKGCNEELLEQGPTEDHPPASLRQDWRIRNGHRHIHISRNFQFHNQLLLSLEQLFHFHWNGAM